ncbi:MAG TPA: ATP-binding protein [Ignavibacteriaceae bacterium]|nr:ATP-binding protein [Ignavibacteriaceae bacterium]
MIQSKSKKPPEFEDDFLQEIPSLRDNKKVVYFFDPGTDRYKYMSSGITNLSGYTPEELNKIGFKHIVKEITEKKIDIFNQNKGDIKETVEEFSATYLIETKDKKNKWVEDNSFTKIDSTGKRIFSIGVLRDVTDFRKNISSLVDTKKRFDAILKLADIVFLMIDKNNNVSLLNVKGHEVFSTNDVVGKNYENLFSDKIKIDRLEEFKKFINPLSDKNQNIEIKFITSSRDEYFISWQKTILRDDEGNISSIVVTGHDITEKKKEANIQRIISQILQAVNTVRNLDELFNFIHKSISEVMLAENFYIALHDKENDIITFPYFIDKYDESGPPIKFGKGLTEYVIKNGRSALIDRILDSQLVAQGEIELIGAQSEIWLGVPLKTKDSTIGALVVQDYEDKFTYTQRHKEVLEAISHPISMAIERKRVEHEREKLISKLSELNQSKDKLFSLISHDLRSPFNSLLGFSEILTTEYDMLTDDEIKEYLNVIYESSKNLYGMTNNLLQYSRFQTGRIEYKPTKFNLVKLIKNSVKLLSGNIIKKEIEFKILSDQEIYIYADEDMMNSAIQNLVSNAVKFTPKSGKVTISVVKKISEDGSGKIELIVEDTGIGISDSDMRKIMHGEMFSTPGTEREYGTGLGMVLIKEFIERNGGDLKIESEKNRGSRFRSVFSAA